MNALRNQLAALSLAGAVWISPGLAAGPAPVAAAENLSAALQNASWIWHPEAQFLCHVRRTFTLDRPPRSATVLVTADNGYELYINGSFVGTDVGADGLIWQSVESYDVTTLLKPGPNVVAVRVLDLGGASGLVASVVAEFESGPAFQLSTDSSWRVTSNSDPTGYTQTDYAEGPDWGPVTVRGAMGTNPWGTLSFPGPISPNLTGGANGRRGFIEAPAGFSAPAKILFIRGLAPESSTPGSPQAVWRIGHSRAYLELDTLGPSLPGRSLCVLERGADDPPSYSERELFHAGAGWVGSPAVTFGGDSILFSYAPAGESFWHVYQLSSKGGLPKQLTFGTFHDFDPEPLPDGRILFSSTRIGSREEYHGNMARSLFILSADGSRITGLTHHIVGDMDPRVTSSGNIVFVRQDNFMERAKVETHIHAIRPDGTAGQVLLGPDRESLTYDRAHAAEQNGLWLRNFGFGSPAPLPDGRVAALSSMGLVISGNQVQPRLTLRPALDLVDIAALPDGRLLCTLAGFTGIGVLDPSTAEITRVYSRPPYDMHSALHLGPRAQPAVSRSLVDETAANRSTPTGFLLGQNVFVTKQKHADVSRIKAIRVIEGRPFPLRSARHPYDHLGVEAVDLGIVPVAADGSFYVEVPADRALALQAIDGEGRSIINELSWIYVRPGEQRSCIGCHSAREAAPQNSGTILALAGGPVKLLGQGEPHRWRGNNAANGGVLNLQFERMREAGSISLHSPLANNASPVPSRSALQEELLHALQSSDVNLKNSAAQHLALLRDQTAAPALAAALNDPAPDVRMNAALALAACGTRDSIPPLLKALRDRSPPAAQSAHLALCNLTAQSRDFQPSGPEQRAGAQVWRTWFETNAWTAIEERLVSQLRPDQSESNLEDVLNALGHIGTSGAAAAIRSLLENPAPLALRVRLAGYRALGQLRDPSSIPFLNQALRTNSSRQTNAPAGDHEFGWTQAPVHVAAAAAEALGRIGTPEAARALVASFQQLEEFWHYTYQTADHDWLMGCHSSLVHFRILEALDRTPGADLSPLVAAVLKSVPIDTDRALLFENDAYEQLAGRIIRRSGLTDQVVAACLDVFTGQSTVPPQLRAAVVESPPAVSVGPLCAESRAAQLLSIVIWSEQDAAHVLTALNRYRAQPPSRTRSWTCFYLARALGKIRSTAAIPSLVAALESDPDEASFGRLLPPNVFVHAAMSPRYRAAAAYALGQIGKPSAFPALLKAAAQFENAVEVRYAAARALYLLPQGEHVAALQKLARDYPEPTTRRVLLSACEKALGGAPAPSPIILGH